MANKKHFILLMIISFLTVSSLLFGVVVKTDQKKGTWQDKPEKHVYFDKIETVDVDFEKMPLKQGTKIDLYMDNIFILDSKRNVLYVMDRKGNYLYPIGRPGAGPGDLEYAWDFFISTDEKVYVLNSMPMRIEIFDIKGKSLNSVRLDRGSGGYFGLNSILVDKKNNFIIGATFSKLVSMFDSKGKFIKSFLTLNEFKGYPKFKNNIGSPIRLAFLDEKIFAFDDFIGYFAKINPLSGEVETVFNEYSERILKAAELFEKDMGSDPNGYMSSTSFTNICVDDNKLIYVFELGVEKKGLSQKMVVFSSEGNLLYTARFPFLSKCGVRRFDIDKNSFVFLTDENNVIIANRRK